MAKQDGVGVGTVSRALNGTGYVSPDTKKKIEKAVRKLGYTPNELARNLYRNRTGIVGVMVPDLDHPFFSCLAKHIEMELYRPGYKTMICNTIGISDREKDYLDMLDRNMVDGIITGAHSLDGEEYLKRKKPIVSIDREFGPGIPLIGREKFLGRHPDIDGVFGGDMAAIACMNAVLQKGIRVPEEVKIIGFDGMDVTRLVYPRLTAVRQNVQLLAELCVNTLLDLVEERKGVPHSQILDVEMQLGGTTL